MAAEFPTAIPVFTGTSETAPATTTPSDFATWAQKVEDELLAITQKIERGPGKAVTESFISGLWNSPEGTTGNANVMTQDLMYARRYEFPYGATLTQFGCWVATAGTASAFLRVGAYNDDGTGTYPGTLLVDGGQMTADISTTGFKSTSAFTATDFGGVKWIAHVLQGAALGTGVLSGLTAGGRGMAITTVPSQNAFQSYTHAAVSGVLPGTFTATRAVANVSARIFYKG